MKKNSSEKVLNIDEKNINALRRCSTKASNVSGKRSPLKFLLLDIISYVIHSHLNLTYFLKVTYILHRSNNRLSKEIEGNSPKLITYLPVHWDCFLMFARLLSFQYVKNCWRSYILILHALQEASNILVISAQKLQGVKGHIFDRTGII